MSATEFTLEEVISALESIRADTSRKDEGNKEFKETAVASLDLHLPKREGEVLMQSLHMEIR